MAQGDWAGLINTTTAQYIPGVSERNIFRNRKTWAMARQQGRIFFDGNGRYQDWKVEYRENPLRPYGADTNLVYPRLNRYFTAQLEWRGYSGTDSMGVMEQAQNKGSSAIIQMYGEKAEKLLESLTRHLADELYVDGTTADNALRFHGLQSFLGYTIDSGTYTIGGATLHRPTALPASFYATKPCTLGGLGGSWSGVWPDGTGDTEYDAWSPLIVHYGSDFFSGTPTWKANGHAALLYYLTIAGRNAEMDMNTQGATNVQLVTMTHSMFYDWVRGLESDKERLVVDPQGGLLRQLGFTTGVVNYMGTDITWEYANPANNFFGWNFPSMRITSLMPQMFTPYGPFQDQESLGNKWAVLVLGNIRCNPRGFGRGVAA